MDIVGREVRCEVCGQTKSPVGRSISPVTASSYCKSNFMDSSGCEGYDQEPKPGWLFHGELWSDSFGSIPMPEPSECYVLVNEEEA